MLEMMKKNARQKFEKDLNWQVFGKKVKEVIDKLV
jgi:hypothetical protein